MRLAPSSDGPSSLQADPAPTEVPDVSPVAVEFEELPIAATSSLNGSTLFGGSTSEHSRRRAPSHLYEAARLSRQGTIETFKSTSPDRLAGLLADCVAVEGPVHVERAMRVAAESFGIQRVGHLIRQALLEALASPAATLRVERRGEFLWPREPRPLRVRGADVEGWVRPIREVAPEEIALAAETILDEAFSLHRDDLVVATAR